MAAPEPARGLGDGSDSESWPSAPIWWRGWTAPSIGSVPSSGRRRGRSAGELLVELAEMMAVGGDHLVHLEELRAVGEVMAPTTAGQLMRRLNARQCKAAVAELAEIAEEVDGKVGLTASGPVTLDLDSSDTEVYGRRKQGRRSTIEASAATTASW